MKNKKREKIKEITTLEKQYEDIVTGLFKKYSTECLKDAIKEMGGMSGNNVQCVINFALDKIRENILGDLGFDLERPFDGTGRGRSFKIKRIPIEDLFNI